MTTQVMGTWIAPVEHLELTLKLQRILMIGRKWEVDSFFHASRNLKLITFSGYFADEVYFSWYDLWLNAEFTTNNRKLGSNRCTDVSNNCNGLVQHTDGSSFTFQSDMKVRLANDNNNKCLKMRPQSTGIIFVTTYDYRIEDEDCDEDYYRVCKFDCCK